MSEVYVMVTICSRKNMPRFVDCYKDYNVEAANISLGRGISSISNTQPDINVITIAAVNDSMIPL